MSIYKIMESGLGKVMDVTMEGLESMVSDRMKEGVESAPGQAAVALETTSMKKDGTAVDQILGKTKAGLDSMVAKASTDPSTQKATLISDKINNAFDAVKGKIADIAGAGVGVAKKAGGAISNSTLGKVAKSTIAGAKSMGKAAGIAGGVATLLRQSQLFTGVVGMIFQIIGAFIDIILIPFMPFIMLSMRLIAKLLPPLMILAFALMKVTQFIADIIGMIGDWVFKVLEIILNKIWGIVDGWWDTIKQSIVDPLWEKLKKDWGDKWVEIKERFAKIVNTFWSVWASMSSWFKDTWDGLVADFKALPEDVMGILTSVGTFVSGIGTHITDAWGTASTWFTTNIIDKVTGWFDDHISTPIKGVINEVKDWVKEKWLLVLDIPDKVKEVADWVADFSGKIGGWIRNAITNAWNGIKIFFTSTVPDAIKVAFGFVTSKVEAIYSFFSTIIAPIASFVQGVLNKISGYILSIIGFMGNIDRFGIGERVRQTMGFGGTKEDFNRVISQRKMALSEESKKPQEINLIIKQEAETTQQAIRASNIQAASINLAAARNNDLMLQDGMQ